MAGDEVRTALPVALHDLGELLGVEPLRERSPADEVAQQDGELATLGRVAFARQALASHGKDAARS
ncbi:MAG: hypothetical protein M5U08_15615 [Burkholderiales bacterium]|nr:hypothetical protein [Burkholderiales bacterium]